MSFLERAPQDVILEIALLGAASDFDCRDILSLLLTSSRLHNVLNIRNCPLLYAVVFRAMYGAPFPLPYRMLAAELVRRCTLLRRLRRGDMTPDGLNQDMQTAVGMLLENNVSAYARLADVGLPRFVLALWQTRRDALDEETKGLVLVVLSLTLRHEDFDRMSIEDRQEFEVSLIPYIMPKHWHDTTRVSAQGHHCAGDWTDCTPELCALAVSQYSIHEHSAHPMHAALQMYCAARWATNPEPPSHLPPTRASAILQHRPGPTMDDCRGPAFSFRTPFFADACDRVGGGARSGPASTIAPGALTGVWEGFLMVAIAPHARDGCVGYSPDASVGFSCKRPVQIELAEYLSDDSQATMPGPLRCLRAVEPSQAHAEAWGAYTYAGDVKDDGLVQLIRQPTAESHGQADAEWLFSGRVLPGGAFVGYWRVLDGAGRGVFSMCKRA
ncbi:hypothetical protein HDZ31DRAFT_33806 [Schizophyllum fasciatum]